MPRVRYFTMGINKWQTSDTWPPQRRAADDFLIYQVAATRTRSNGDGALSNAAPAADSADKFDYDPMNPVPSYGGNVCCTGNAVQGGAFDQRKMEERDPTFWSTALSL